MLFHDGVFCPELLSDGRAREVLSATASQNSPLIEPVDFLAGAIRCGDPAVMETLQRALRSACSLPDLVHAVDDPAVPFPEAAGSPRSPESFSPESLELLDQYEGMLRSGVAPTSDVALELLMFLVLQRIRERDGRLGGLLDTRLAAALFRERVTATIGWPPGSGRPLAGAPGDPSGTDSTPEEPFRIPAQLAPSDDLTHRVHVTSAAAPFPFDGEPSYNKTFEVITRALHRQTTRHVFLVGERGVGKSTVVAELARRAAIGQISFLKAKRLVMVDCRYVAPEESRERLVAILSYVAGRADLVVCLDGFASLLQGERATSNKAILLSTLSRVQCQIIGLMTPHDYETYVSGEPDMSEFFTAVEVPEPEVEVAIRLLNHFRAGLEDKFRVTIEPQAVRQAVVLSVNYILNERLPAKALKILYRVCEDIDYERAELGGTRDRVTFEDVVKVVSQISGVPEETLRGIAERSDYERSLGEVILGQEHAVREVTTELGLIKAGFRDPNKPASVMLFVGQTGTGKTEMGKALARFYSTSKRLRTYTLGNFVEPHSVAGIIGVPPGYVGHDQGGRLVNDLNADPYCVFLLDEADKSHPDVLQPFLNLFDEGWIRDQRGVQAYADKSIFILTTNVGQRMIADLAAKGESMEEITRRMKEALSQIRHSKSNRPVFAPEFLARIKRIIVFKPLDHDAMTGICRKLVREMQQSWQETRGKSLVVPEQLIQHIADRAHDLNEKSKGKEGGRIVRKLIAELIEATVQREATRHTEHYRDCHTVALQIVVPDDSQTPPTITVRFRSQNLQ